MDRDRHARPDPLIHRREFVAAGMAGNVDRRVAVGDDLHAQTHQFVLDLADRLLVAGNRARREQRPIPFFEHDMGMVVGGDARQGRARLPLRPRADQHDALARHVAGVALREEGRYIGEIAVLARGFVDAPQRAADQSAFAPRLARRARDAFQARDVRGETRHDHALGRFLDELGDAFVGGFLGARLSVLDRVGRIPDQRQHALGSDAPERGFVGQRPQDGCGIELPIAGVQHGARGRADGQRVGFRDRVGDVDELDLELAQLQGRTLLDRVQRNLAGEVGLGELAPQERGGETRGVDRAAQQRP